MIDDRTMRRAVRRHRWAAKRIKAILLRTLKLSIKDGRHDLLETAYSDTAVAVWFFTEEGQGVLVMAEKYPGSLKEHYPT